MLKFRRPYFLRIMISLPMCEPIELMRSRYKLTPDQIMGWIRDLDPIWEIRVEQPLDQKYCLSSRQ